MITSQGNTLVLNAIITASLNTVNYFVFKNITGEFFRKIPTDIETINSKSKVYTCWLNEYEGNDTIKGICIICSGTEEINTGVELATQSVNVIKDNTQSLLLEWTVEIR